MCQDFVHLALILLRRRGIAARYVSGYSGRRPRTDGEDSIEVDTHAWLEVLLPGAAGAASRRGSAPTRPTAGSRARRT